MSDVDVLPKVDANRTGHGQRVLSGDISIRNGYEPCEFYPKWPLARVDTNSVVLSSQLQAVVDWHRHVYVDKTVNFTIEIVIQAG